MIDQVDRDIEKRVNDKIKKQIKRKKSPHKKDSALSIKEAVEIAGGLKPLQVVDKLNEYLEGSRNIDSILLEAYKKIVRCECESSIYFHHKHVLGFNLLTEQTHKGWCNKLQKDFYNFNQFMRLKPRDIFKTTTYGEGFILWVWGCISPAVKFFYTSANQILLDEVSVHMDSFLKIDNTSLWSFVFDIKRDSNVKNTVDTFNLNKRDEKVRGSSLVLRTVGGSKTGIHPNFIIIDDPCDDKDRESKAVRNMKVRWLESLYPLLREVYIEELSISIKKRMYIATMWHTDDLTNNLIKANKDKRDVDKFDIEIEGVYKEDGSLQYPELFPEERIQSLKSELSIVFFTHQYLNKPITEENAVFTQDMFTFYDKKALFEPQAMDEEGAKENKRQNKARLEFYGYSDLAVGRSLKGDMTATVTIGYEKDYNIFYVYDCKVGRMKHHAAIDSWLIQDDDYHYELFGCENNQFQDIVKEYFEERLIEEGKEIAVMGVTHMKRTKEHRIEGLQPYIKHGNVVFPYGWETDIGMRILMEQLLYFGSTNYDDAADALEGCVKIINDFGRVYAIG